MKHQAKNKETGSKVIPRENGELLPSAQPPSKKWRKLYDCKKTKGQHDWDYDHELYVGQERYYKRYRVNAPYGWEVEIAIETTHNRYPKMWGGYKFDADYWWGKTLTPEEWVRDGVPDGMRHHFRRSRIIKCKACGHSESEHEYSTNDGETWIPTESTIRQRKKHGTTIS
jgi:hypothetical protein